MTKLQSRREELGLSQEKLARKANLSRTTITNLESGKQTSMQGITVVKLARALDLPPQELLAMVENKE